MSKRKHDCNTCKHEYEPKQPNIRPFTQEEFDRAFKDKKVWKRVLFSTVSDGWKRAKEHTSLEEWHGTCLWSEYGLPADDPFFKPSFHHDGDGERAAQPDPPTVPPFDKWAGTKPEIAQPDPLVGKKVWWDGIANYGKTSLKPCFVRVLSQHNTGYLCSNGVYIPIEHLSLTPPPLVKVWAIDKTGEVSKYQFRAGEDNPVDWERMKRENEGAEEIVVNAPAGVKGLPDCYTLFNKGGAQYYNIMAIPGSRWYKYNPVESIRAEIKKRNAPKFKVGNIVKADGVLWRVEHVINPITPLGQEYVVHSLDGKMTHTYPRDFLTYATRDDFKVERGGHTWLAEYNGTGDIKLYHNFTGKKAYGNATFNTLTTWNEYGQAICEALNLPVCPAGLE